MRRMFLILAGVLFTSTLVADQSYQTLQALADRVSPKLKERVSYQIRPDSREIKVSPLKNSRDMILITAPSVRLAAAGLGCYLREVAKAHWSWCGNRLDGAMPQPARTYTFTPAYPHSWAYNYCTLCYTMAFWDKTEWRKEIDRLALFGYEMALVQAGLPKIWQETLRELGYPEEKIRAFIPDDAATAWWNMGNLEGLGGPVSQEQIDANAELGRFIVHEMKALGMKPALQCFTGLVPSGLPNYLDKKVFTDCRFFGQGTWCGLRRPTLLDPTTKAFKQISEIWYRNLKKVYQIEKVDVFAGDLFHEGGSTHGVNVTACARIVQAEQQKASPNAIWAIQAWGGNPRGALLKGLDPKLTVIEALVDNMRNGNLYSRSFGEFPWIWCELLNFGGNHNYYGGIDVIAKLGDQTRTNGAKTLAGFGMLSEGFESNPLFYDLFSRRLFLPKEKIFSDSEIDRGLADYALCRYGVCDPHLLTALRILKSTVYAPPFHQQGCTENIQCAKPSWNARKARTWARADPPYYPLSATLKAAEAYTAAAAENPGLVKGEAFLYDWIDIVRQCISDLSRPLLSLAREDQEARKLFLDSFIKIDTLLACHPLWRLDYLEGRAARIYGKDGIKGYRRMITTWVNGNSSLNDYANRQLSGLMRHYYMKRWEAFFATPGEWKTIGPKIDRLNRTFPTAELPGTQAPRDPVACIRETLKFVEDIHRRYPQAFRQIKGQAWNLKANKGPLSMSFSVGDQIPDAGDYEVQIRWTRGPQTFKIKKVELFEGDRCVASDIHDGSVGKSIRQGNRYLLRLRKFRDALDDYTLKISGEGDGAGPANGTFTITLK